MLECGQVCHCLKNNPNYTNKEIALITKLTISSVIKFRPIAEKELGLPMYTGDPQPKQVNTPLQRTPIFPPLQSKGKRRFIIYKHSCPVALNAEYNGKIVNITSNGVGVALINEFSCQVPGAFLGEIVRFRINKITENCAYTVLVQVIQKNLAHIENPIKLPVKQPILQQTITLTTSYAGKRCSDCNFPITDNQFDLNDGLCASCYVQKEQSDEAKYKRRSGIYGSDRAGTW